MAHVEKWRLENPYIVVVRRHPTLDDQWVLELPTGVTLTAPVRFDDDGDPVFSLAKARVACARRIARLRSDRHGF